MKNDHLECYSMHHPGHPLLIYTPTHHRSTMSCSLKVPMKYKYHAQHWLCTYHFHSLPTPGQAVGGDLW